MKECKPLYDGSAGHLTEVLAAVNKKGFALTGRSLHSLTSQLNLRTFGTRRSRHSST